MVHFHLLISSVPSVIAYVNEAAVRKIYRKSAYHEKMLSLENLQRKTAAEVLINMSGAESLIQDYTSTSTSTE